MALLAAAIQRRHEMDLIVRFDELGAGFAGSRVLRRIDRSRSVTSHSGSDDVQELQHRLGAAIAYLAGQCAVHCLYFADELETFPQRQFRCIGGHRQEA
jgi:hypothetical protein